MDLEVIPQLDSNDSEVIQEESTDSSDSEVIQEESTVVIEELDSSDSEVATATVVIEELNSEELDSESYGGTLFSGWEEC